MMNTRRSTLPIGLLVAATALLLPESSFAGGFAGGVFRTASCDIIWYMQGSLGALLVATAVVFGVAAAAAGNTKTIMAAVFAGIGAYAMYDIVKMQFGDIGCNATGQGRAGRSAEVQVVPQNASREANPFSAPSSSSEPIIATGAASPTSTAASEEGDDDTASQNSWRQLSAE